MHSCVNVVISGLPLSRPTCLLRLHPLQATLSNIHIALSAATGLPCHAVRLFCDGRAAPQFPMSAKHQQQQQQSPHQQHTLFLTASVARALPGGKGGFGAMLRSTASSSVKKTSNFDACRDLHGRRLRDVHAARALASATAEKATAANAKRVQLQHGAGACADANMTETTEQKVDRQDEQEQLDTETLVHAMDKTAADTRIALEKARMRRKAARNQKRTGSGKRRRHIDVVEVMQSAQPQHHQLQQVQSPPQHMPPNHVNDLEPLRKSHHSSPKRRRISVESHTRAHVPH